MTVNLDSTDTTQTIVYMTALMDSTSTGGSPIVSYSLEWDNGSNGASLAVINGDTSNSIQLQYIASDLTAGLTY